jgi:hypothetical protein
MVSAPAALLGFMPPSVRLFALNSHNFRCDEWGRFADVHMDLERDIADFLCAEASILYSQGFSRIPCVISAFGFADRDINFSMKE